MSAIFDQQCEKCGGVGEYMVAPLDANHKPQLIYCLPCLNQRLREAVAKRWAEMQVKRATG